MKILHLVHQYPPEHIGGTEFYTQWLTQAQQAAGHEVAVFHRRSGDGSGLEQHQLDGVSIYSAWAESMTPSNRFRTTFGNQPLNQLFAKTLAEFNPDLVHIQHLMGLPTSLANQIHAAAMPYFVTLHDYFYFCANAQLITNYDQTLCAGPKAWVNCARCTVARAGHPKAVWGIPPLVPLLGWRNQQLKRVLIEANGLIAPSQFVKDIYVKQGIATEKIAVIPHGITPPDESTLRRIVQKRPFSTPPLKVIYIGGISPQKGVDVLITAVNQLSSEQIECKIYGDLTSFPGYVKQLEQMILGQNILLAGKLPRAKLWDALLAADVLVVPALWHETSSLVIDEAFAVKLPVLVSKLGGMTEKVTHGKNGFHIEPGDADGMASRFRQFISQPELLNGLRPFIPPTRTIQQHNLDILNLYRSNNYFPTIS